MKTKLKSYALLAFLFCAMSFSFQAQEYVEMMNNPHSNFYDVQAAFNSYWEGKTIEKGKGYKAFRRWEAYMIPRVYPSGNMTLASLAYENFLAWETNNSNTGIPKSIAGNWTLMGPIGKPVGGGAGRLNFVRFDPTNSNTMYVGAPDGGLWKTTNGGTTWSTNTDQLAVIGVSDIAIDPTNTQIMYIATGDGEAGDSYSVGVLKSTNGGTTWNTTGLSWTASQGRKISRLLIDPTNPLIIMAFGSNGIWRTTNGGTTWTQPTGTFNSVMDAEFKPGDPNTVYAAGTVFKKSTNGGLNWTTITTGLTGIGRLAIAVTAANPAYVYVLASRSSDSGFLGFLRSTDSGTTFTTRMASTSTNNILGWNNGSDSGGQGWYDLGIAASPTNAEEIYTGGINMWKSTNGGTSFTLNSHWTGSYSKPYVHADIHDIQYLPGSGTTVFSCNDGGINKTTNSGTTWTDISSNLAIAQQYRIGLSTSNANLLIAGHQDNGTNRYNGTNWTQVYGGDGMDCFIDRTNNNIMVGSYVYGDYYRSTNGGTSFSSINSGIPAGTAWLSVIHQDPVTAATYYAGGRTALYRTTNSGTAWSALGTPTGTGSIIEFAIAPSNNQIIYALKSGTNGVSKSTNGGTSFTAVSTGLPTTVSPTYIAVSNTDPNVAFVCYSGYGATSKVYKTINGGTSWTNLSTGLPNLPVNCVVYHNGSANDAVYVGTDVGVYYKDNTTSWIAFNTGLPNVSVTDLEIYYATGRLRAATFGRGTWDSDLYSAAPSAPVANFTPSSTTICVGQSVTYTNTSTNLPTSYSWTFAGGTPATSTATNPTVTYNTIGTYDVSLTATNASGSNTLNQTNYINVVSATGVALPLTEGFTSTTFVPTNWTLVNTDLSPTTWARSATVGFAPTAGNSMFFDNFTYNDVGNTDEVRTQKLNFTGLASAQMTFDVAYAPYDATYNDGLEVLVSTDCGATFTSVYSKSYTVLATAPATTASFVPSSSQWRTETINLNTYVGQTGVTIAIRNLAGYGNNIYVDNININGVSTPSAPVASFISSPSSPVCVGQTVQYTSTSTNSPTSYSWTFTGGTPATSSLPNPTVTYAAAGSYTVALTATNAQGSNTLTQPAYITIIAPPATPGTISGSTSICSSSTGNIYSIAAVSGATSYTWSVPTGASVTAGQGTTSATITFGTTSGNVTVTATNSCGTSTAAILAISLNSVPATPGSITPPANLCSGSTGNLFSVGTISGATSYTWSVPSGSSVTSGQGTNSATITLGATSGNVSVTATNSCGTSTASSIPISIQSSPSTPGTITGSTTACISSSGNVYSISSVSGAMNYTWSVPSGASITSGQGSTSVNVTFGATSGNVSVTASNSCGTSSSSIVAVTLTSSAPSTPGSITGNNSICSNSTGNVFSVAAVSGATSYTWSVPAGASITSGQGSNLATINFGSTPGNISVTASSNCGTSAASTLNITFIPIPATPGSISGQNTECEGASGISYSIASVSGASSYTWSMPTGSTITSGQGTISINTIIGVNSGNITVTASNSCGTSTASVLALTVNPNPVVTQSAYSAICDSGSPFTLTNGSPVGGTYSGSGVTSGIFDPTTLGAGTFSIDYSFTSNGCTNNAISSITVNDCAGINEVDNQMLLTYPNPTDGMLTIKGEALMNYTHMTLIDATGRIVEQWNIDNDEMVLNLEKCVSGLYSLRFIGDTKVLIRKIEVR